MKQTTNACLFLLKQGQGLKEVENMHLSNNKAGIMTSNQDNYIRQTRIKCG